MSDSWVKKTATVKFMRVYERLVVGTLWYTSLPVYEWRVYMERKTFHDKFMSGSWAGYEWMILGAPDSWNHTRDWYCIFWAHGQASWQRKQRFHEQAMKRLWEAHEWEHPRFPRNSKILSGYIIIPSKIARIPQKRRKRIYLGRKTAISNPINKS